jgi:hypothetical protein
MGFSGRAGLIGSSMVHRGAGHTALSVQGQNTSRTAPVRFPKKKSNELKLGCRNLLKDTSAQAWNRRVNTGGSSLWFL